VLAAVLLRSWLAFSDGEFGDASSDFASFASFDEAANTNALVAWWLTGAMAGH